VKEEDNRPLSQGVATVDADLSTGHVPGCVTQEEDNRTHEVLGVSHLAEGNQGSPLLAEVGILIEDLAGAVTCQYSIQIDNSKRHGTYRAVSMYPGLMQFTRMLEPAHSTPKDEAR